MKILNFSFTVKERFLRYAQIDTQSEFNSPSTPSSMKQLDLARLLVTELKEIGAQEVEMAPCGYVYATIPSTLKNTQVPVICYNAHMDTTPEFCGSNVKPLCHPNYKGQEIILPDNPQVILSPKRSPELRKQIGNEIITASGTTLLGADNKAGVAAIMDLAYQLLVVNPNAPHGKIRLLFSTDEEVMRGMDHIDLKKLGADFAYSIDGETAGSYEWVSVEDMQKSVETMVYLALLWAK